MNSTPTRVLLLDDDPNLRGILSDILNMKGYQPVPASTGAAALALLEQQQVQVALIDLKLEDVSGLEILRLIKTRSPATECIMLTGNATQGSAIEAINLGAYSYFQKPYEVDQLLVAIRRAAEKHASDAALLEREARFRSMIENSSDVICILNQDASLRYVSPSSERILGYALTEVEGISLQDFIHPEDLPSFLEAYQRVLQSPEPVSLRLRMQHKDGAWRTLEGIGRNLLADPAIQGIIINARDITARLLAEAALQQAEVRFRTLVEHSPAITYIVSPGLASPVTYISPQIEQVLGFTPAEWMAQPGLWETLLYPEDRESALADGDWSAPTGEPFISEYRIYTKDGRLVWLHDENVQVRDEQGRLLFIQGIETDITARKQAEQALKESQQSYQSLVEQVPGVFYRDNLDENASSLFVSPQIQDLIGYSPAEWRADPDMWVNRLHPDDHDRILAENKHHLVTGEKLDSEYRLLARAGHVVWVRDQAIIFRDAAGQPLYDQGTLIDITARKQAEERLSKLNQCFLSFGADPLTNINLLVAFTGEAFGATVALYNQLQGEMLCSLGTWNTPPGYRTSDPAGGHICTDVIQSGKDEIVVLRNLQASSYASSDPNVSQYHLQTYIGKPVRFENANIGSLCIVFQKDVIPSDDDQRLLGIVASAMGVEEQRRRAGDELHASEERYRMLAENITDTVWLMDLSLRTTYISPSVTRLRGYTLQELNAIPLDRQVSPDSLQRALQLFAEVLSPQSLAQPVTNGGSNTIELEFIKKDGSTFWSENTFSLIRDPQGAPLAILGSGRDISERKQVEEKLRNSEKYYRLLTENNTDAVVLLDPRGMVLYESPAYARMMGWSTGQRLGKSSFEHLHPQDRESIARLLTELVQNPSQVRQAEFRVQHKDGSWHWIEATATNLLGETAVHGLVVNMHDITEHIQSEAEIRRRVADLEVLYENGLSISVLLDPRQIAEQMINILSKKLNWHHAAIRLYHPESKRLELLALSRPGLTPTETRSEIERLNQNITYPPQGLSGWVFTHTRTIRSGEVQADERYLSTFSDMHSGLYVPLLVGKQAIGSIAVESREPDLFSEDDEHLLQTLAAQSAIAFENARLYQEALSADRRKSALHQAGLEIVRAGQDIEALSQALHQAVGQVMPAEIFVVSLITSDGRSVDAPYYLDQGVRQPNIRQALKAGMTGRVIRSRKSLRVKDVQTLRGPKPIMNAGAQPPRSFLAVPLILQDKIVGVLTTASREVNVYSKEDQIFLETLASEAAVAFENARLFQAVVREAERRLVLYRTGQEIVAAGLDLEQVYRSIHQAASELIPLDLLTIVLADEGQHVLHALYLFDKGQRYPAFDMQWDSGLSGHVIRIQKSLLLADYTRQKEVRSVMFGDASEPRAILAVPLRSGARIVGVLSVQSYAPDVYREEDQILLEMLAAYAGTAIENSRLYQDVVREAEHRLVLYRTGQEIVAAGLDLEQVYRSIHQAASELIQLDVFTITLSEEDGDASHAVYLIDKGQRFPSLDPDSKNGLAAHVIRTKKSLRIADYTRQTVIQTVMFGTSESSRSILAVPLQSGNRIVGVLSVQSYEADVYREEDQILLEMLASYAGTAIENSRLFEAERDQHLLSDALRNALGAGASLSRTLDSVEVRDRLLEGIEELLPWDDSTLMLVEAHTGEAVVTLAHARSPSGERNDHSLENYRLSLGETDNLRWMAEHRQAMVIPDVSAYPGWVKVEGSEMIKSWIGAPIVVNGQVMAFFSLSKREPNFYTPEHVRLLEAFSGQASLAFQNARLFEETRRRLAEMESLSQVSLALASVIELQPLLENILSSARQAIPSAEKGTICLSDSNQALRISALSGYSDPRLLGLLLPPEQNSYAVRAARERTPIKIDDSHIGYEIPFSGTFAEIDAVQSGIAAPLLAKGKLIGVISLDNASRQAAFTESDLHLLVTFASSAAVAIENARLFTETQLRLHRLTALHAVDIAIGASVDTRVTLSIVLENVMAELKADAVAVLLFNPVSRVLEYVAGRGFRVHLLEGLRLRLGEGLAGLSALQRRPINIPDMREPGAVEQALQLPASTPAPPPLPYLQGEEFVAYHAMPLVAKGQVQGVLEIFSRSPMPVDQEWISFLEMLAGQTAIAVDSGRLFENLQRTNLDLTLAYDATIQGWSQALELRDEETQGHTRRVTELTMRLFQAMGLAETESEHARRGSLLHDIGKIAIPDSILLKPGPLDAEEWKVMRQHPQYAYNLLSPITYLLPAVHIPYCHHEKWDGSGYPRGLKGEDIPQVARIFAIVDVYDALTSNRPYRQAWPTAKALDYIREQSGSHFDPRVVNAFMTLMADEK